MISIDLSYTIMNKNILKRIRNLLFFFNRIFKYYISIMFQKSLKLKH